MPIGEFQLKGKSKMCHCNDNLALLPMVAKVLKEKNEKGIHPGSMLDLREEAASKKSGQGRNFPFRIYPSYGL